VKVALSGLGGDELFAGYSSFRTVPRMEKFANSWDRAPKMLQSVFRQMFVALAPASDQNRKLAALGRNGAKNSYPYFISRMLFTPEQQLRPGMKSGSANFERAQASMNETANHAASLDPINRVSYLEARCYMLNTLLRDSDSMSMAHGLEVRVPLIDYQLARRLLALPGYWKLDAATPKPLLVRALGGQLPDNIVHRPKRGFTLPLEYWLRDAMRPAVENALGRIEDGPLGQMINAGAARRVWADFLQGKTSWSRPWALYVLQNWCERHLQS
jgi:asparagine synthase (glutamine-hydrolysing)